MDEIIKRLGSELQVRYYKSLRHPMNWQMIDAFAKLEEAHVTGFPETIPEQVIEFGPKTRQ